MEHYLPILRQIELFSGLTDADILLLCRAFGCHVQYFSAPRCLWHRGERPHSAGVVLRGEVRAERTDADGRVTLVARQEQGALFGDVLISSRQKRSPVDVYAEEGAMVLFLPAENLMREGGEKGRAARERFRQNLLSGIADKYWALDRRLSYCTAPSLRVGLARFLLDLREVQGRERLRPGLSREQLSWILSANRSAVSRELSHMQRDGLLRLEGKEIVLTDVQALRELTL